MAYSIDSIRADCYPNTTVLINKFDIRDENKLAETESVLSTVRSAQWLTSPMCSTFDFDHYKMIHRFIFSDIYDWAGKVRDVDISKKGTRFVAADRIEAQAEAVFNYLKQCNFFKNLPKNEFVEQLLDFYCTTNHLHPFREGNGRTQRIFLVQLALNAGHEIRFSDIDPDLLIVATVHAAQGVTDLLRQLFVQIID